MAESELGNLKTATGVMADTDFQKNGNSSGIHAGIKGSKRSARLVNRSYNNSFVLVLGSSTIIIVCFNYFLSGLSNLAGDEGEATLYLRETAITLLAPAAPPKKKTNTSPDRILFWCGDRTKHFGRRKSYFCPQIGLCSIETPLSLDYNSPLFSPLHFTSIILS